MGLPMDDIHTPTVPSGPASSHDSHNTNGAGGTSLMGWIAEKARIEEELKALSSVLDSHGVNMNTSLTTFDGYPRDDIDIAQSLPPSYLGVNSAYSSKVRTTRARIIRLRNDYKSIMSKIEDGLHAHHAQARDIPIAQSSISSSQLPTSPASSLEAPFAKVNSVVAGSPADDAGLKPGDVIRRFGDVDWINHEKLSKVAETVQRSEGRASMIGLKRSSFSDLNNRQPSMVKQTLLPPLLHLHNYSSLNFALAISDSTNLHRSLTRDPPYLHSMAESAGAQAPPTFKLVLVGDGGTGKVCVPR
ncbi:MAG: hypothetical protein Q9224_002398 [Gallowayella concinna]